MKSKLLILICIFEVSTLVLGAASKLKASYVFTALLVVVLLVDHFLLERKSNRHKNSNIFELLFIGIIVMTMIVRGSGIKLLGSNMWGGSSYFVLLLCIIFSILAKRMDLNYSVLRKIIFLMAVFAFVPLVLDILMRIGILPEAVSQYFDIPRDSYRFKSARHVGIYIVLYGLLKHPLMVDGKFNKRIMVFVIPAIIIGGISGHRLSLLMVLLLLFLSFIFEKKYKKFKIIFYGILLVIPLFLILLISMPYMPENIQRTFSFIAPAETSSMVEKDATGSLEFRLKIWAVAIVQAPKYVVVGKGFAFDSYSAYYLTNSKGMGIDAFAYVNNYHNGPLSVFMTLGTGGIILFFIIFIRYIVKYYKYYNIDWMNGSEKRIFRVLFIYYTSVVIEFILFFGDITKTSPHLFLVLALLHIAVHNRRERRIEDR